MSGNDTEGLPQYGVDGYVWGLKILFWLYALFVFIRVAEPAAVALGISGQTGEYREEATGIVLAVLVIGLFIVLFLGLFYAAFLFISLHNVDVVLSSSLSSVRDVSIFNTQRAEYGSSAEFLIEPEVFFPQDIAGLFFLIPPALLIYAGYMQRLHDDDVVTSVLGVVIGYGIMTLVTIIPVKWIFNNFIAQFVAEVASSKVTEAAVHIHYPNLVEAHLVVGVVYPLIFGGVGAAIAEITQQ